MKTFTDSSVAKTTLLLFICVCTVNSYSLVRNTRTGTTYPTITQAVHTAEAYDTLNISTGIYRELVVIDSTYLTLNGGYDADALTPVADAHSVITKAPVHGAALAVYNSTAVVSSVSITGVHTFAINIRYSSIVTMRHCRSSYNAASILGSGAGLCVRYYSQATLENTEISHNSASQFGGGIFVASYSSVIAKNSDTDISQNTAKYGGGVSVTNSSFEICDGASIMNNTSTVDGGGVHAVSSDTYLNGQWTNWVYLHDNYAGGNGGAVFASDGTKIEGTCADFAANIARNGGAVCAMNGSDVTLYTSDLYDNSAHATDDMLELGGGAVALIDKAQMTAVNSRFTGNVSSNYGGAIAAHMSSLIITGTYARPVLSSGLANEISWNKTLKSGRQGGGILLTHNSYGKISKTSMKFNESMGYGGALYVYSGSTCDVDNCLIIKNDAASTDGARVAYDALRMNYCTVAHNDQNGIQAGADAALSLTNCIVWGHSEENVEAGYDVQYSDIQGGYPTGMGNTNLYPEFTDTNGFNYTLSAGSPCIEAGIDIPGITQDCMGDARVQGLNPDMGCYEAVPEPACIFFCIGLLIIAGRNRVQ